MATVGFRRALAVVAVIAIALVACSPQDYGDGDLGKVKRKISDKKIRDVRSKIARETEAPPAPKQDGKIVVTVKDGTGLVRPFIQVRVRSQSGRTSTVLMTDARGKARATVTAGTWHAEVIPGCQEKMIVTFADARTLKVPEKGTAKATLRADATRRYMPGTPLTWDISPPWPDDRDVELRFRWADRCGDGGFKAENFSKLVTVSSSGRLDAYARDMKSDAQGWVTVTLSCRPPIGTTDAIWFGDRFNEKDQVNVLTLAKKPARGWCA